jgi:hypothetical protein
VQARLCCCRSETRVIFSRENHHRVLAVDGHALRPLFPSLSHDLTKTSFGILELPSRERAMGSFRPSSGRVRISRGLPHDGHRNYLSRLVRLWGAGPKIQSVLRYGARNGSTTRSRSSSTIPSCISSDQRVSQSACSRRGGDRGIPGRQSVALRERQSGLVSVDGKGLHRQQPAYYRKKRARLRPSHAHLATRNIGDLLQ